MPFPPPPSTHPSSIVLVGFFTRNLLVFQAYLPFADSDTSPIRLH
jgi:hypothetical protein